MTILKKLTIINHDSAAPITDFDGVDAGVIFGRRVEAAAKHFGIELPFDFDFNKKGSYILGNENDLYYILVDDASKKEEKNYTSDPPAIIEEKPLKVSFDIEFTDSEQKGELIDLMREAVFACTGLHVTGAIAQNFEYFLGKKDAQINHLVGQLKQNSFKIPEDINNALIADDVKAGIRQAPPGMVLGPDGLFVAALPKTEPKAKAKVKAKAKAKAKAKK